MEDSNVDLSEELIKMTVAQGNFQVNAQVNSTADQVPSQSSTSANGTQ
ncbi:MAG: flagellar basal body rod C-terminal domain-containing protein [Chromatiales bacterium]